MTGPATAAPVAAPAEDVFSQWRRVSWRKAIARPAHDLVRMGPVFIVSLVVGNAQMWSILVSAGLLALILILGTVHWLTTRYRVTEQHLEVRSGALVRKHLQIPRERIRGVHLTHEFTYRVLGLSVVRIGAGDRQGASLDGIRAAEATRLQQLLLTRPAGSQHVVADTSQPVDLASFEPRWLLYAPFTLVGWAAVTGLASTATSLAGDLSESTFTTVADGTKAWVVSHSMWLTITLLAVAVVLVVVLGSMAIYLLQYWGFRLTRTHSDHGDMLRVRRGLLTTRVSSITEARLRGVETMEQLLLRAVRGAAATALVTGLGATGQRMTLMPPAPKREALRVCALALRTDRSLTTTPLRRHPRAALRRRLTRAVAPAILLAVLTTVFAPPWAWWPAWALVPALAAVGSDRYRSLGHALTNRYLVTRNGSLLRHTVALQRTGIIGWRFTQSWTQRRAGLLTVSATTAAAAGVYRVLDVYAHDGLRLATAAVPGLLDGILVHHGNDAPVGDNA